MSSSVLLLWALSATSALAGAGISGTSVPSAGGGFAGPTEAGALGALSNPAAVARAVAPELLLDVAVFRRTVTTDLAAWDGPEVATTWAPQPSAGLAVSFGRLGLGAAFQAPTSRGGPQPPEGPQRFFTVDSTLQLVQGSLLAAYRVHDQVSIGAGLRVGQVSYLSEKRVDTGASFNQSFDLDPPLPVGDPLLEGRQRVGAMSGWSASWVAGVQWVLPSNAQIALSFEPPWRIWVAGPIEQEPSLDLNAAIAGEGRVRLGFPAHLTLGGRVPIGRVTLIGDVEYVGWARAGSATSEISGLTITSSDPLFDGILTSSGLAEADFLASSEGTTENELGWHDIVIPGLQAQWSATDTVDLRAGVWYAPTAVSDDHVTPSNLDFATITARLAGAVLVVPQLRTALTVEKLFVPTRHITTSPYSLDQTVDGVLAPSGNGDYALDVWRFGLSAQLFVR
ncbi:MAG: outer membrane protein transport protein [Myxococcota bacterium]